MLLVNEKEESIGHPLKSKYMTKHIYRVESSMIVNVTIYLLESTSLTICVIVLYYVELNIY